MGKENKCRIIITINHCNCGPLPSFAKIYEVPSLIPTIWFEFYPLSMLKFNDYTHCSKERELKVQMKRIFEFRVKLKDAINLPME